MRPPLQARIKRGAYGMLIGDVLGLPLVPWVLAEPIGKEALKKKGEIAGDKKKAKKKAKQRYGWPLPSGK